MATNDETDTMQIIYDLAYTRMSGTDNDEVKCKAYLEEKFKALGTEPIIEPVPWSTFANNVLIRLLVLILICAFLVGLVFEWLDWAWFNLVYIIVIIACLVGAFVAQQAKFDRFVTMGKMQETFNIHAKMPAQSAGDHPAKNIIFMAHHDTKTTTLDHIVRTVSYVVGLIGGLIVGILFIVSSMLKIFSSPPALYADIKWAIVVILVIMSPFVIALLSYKCMEGKTLGSIDNATGMAIVFKMLEHLSGRSFPNTNLWFVITGAEEWGMCGAIEFWKQHGMISKELDPATTSVFNYDSVIQKVCYIEKFGLPRGKPYNKRLNTMSSKAASDLGIPASKFWLPATAITDGWVLKHPGCETMDFITLPKKDNTHSARDTPDKCDGKIMANTIAITLRVVEQLTNE